MQMTSPSEEGKPSAKILFLAEAPSGLEMRFGRPLVGPSGDVFNDCLHNAGLIRRESYILNIWPYRVSKDKNSIFSPQGDKLWDVKKGFTEHGLEAAKPTLDKINASSANLIVTMGAQAMSLLTGDVRPMMKWRGSILSTNPERVSGKKFIPTVHPAATLHGTYLWRYLIISDLEKASVEMQYPDLRLPNRSLLIDPSYSDVIEYFHMLGKGHEVATDIEVINHQTSCFSLSNDPMEAMTVPIGDEYGRSLWNEEQEMSIWLEYARLLGNPDIAKINQNIIGFDSVFLLLQNNIYIRGFLGDPMIAQHIMYPDFNKGLDFIASIHTREPYYKDEGKMWKGMGGDIEQFWRYCAKDSCIALEAWNVLKKEMDEGGYWPTYHRTARLHNPLAFMSIRGLAIDESMLKETHDKITKELKDAEDKLNSVADYPFNPGSPKQCIQYFYINKGITPYHGKSGSVTTDDSAMARIIRKYHLPEAKLVQEIRYLRKLQSTYLEVTRDKDGRLRCSWNPRGAWTGRLSSSQTIFGTGMNLQNLHPKFKKFIVAG